LIRKEGIFTLAERNRQFERIERIAWIGASEGDSYQSLFSSIPIITRFESIFDVVAEVLIQPQKILLVVDAACLGTAWKSTIKSLSEQSLFVGIIVYSTYQPLFFQQPMTNGHAQWHMIYEPQQMTEILNDFITAEKTEPLVDTIKTPEKDFTSSDHQTAMSEPVKSETNEVAEKKLLDEFKPAELTTAELEALLGPDVILDEDFKKKMGKAK
jgi:hypothetical protein